MANEQYLPLNTIVKLDDLPESLSFFGGGVSSVFSNLYFRNYFVSFNLNQGCVLHELILTSQIPLSFEIPISFNVY